MRHYINIITDEKISDRGKSDDNKRANDYVFLHFERQSDVMSANMAFLFCPKLGDGRHGPDGKY